MTTKKATIIRLNSPLACVASVSNLVIARKLEREQKKKMGKGKGEERRKRLPSNRTILKNAPNCFHASMHLQLGSLSSKKPITDYRMLKIYFLPLHSLFFALVPTFSTNSRGNATQATVQYKPKVFLKDLN